MSTSTLAGHDVEADLDLVLTAREAQGVGIFVLMVHQVCRAVLAVRVVTRDEDLGAEERGCELRDGIAQ